MKRITLNQLEILVSVVEYGGFSAASAALDCTQSRISHGIAALEREIGARLLIRSRSGCKPTLAGERVVARAREVLALAAGICEREHDERRLTGTVRIACTRSVATHLLPHPMEALQRQHPGIRVDLYDGCHDYSDVVTSIDHGSAQLGITRGPVDPHLRSWPYVSDRYSVIAPAAMQLRSPVSWQELSPLPFIHIQQPGARWIVEQCQAIGCLRPPERYLMSESGVLALVARRLGFTVLPNLTAFPGVGGTQVLALSTPIRRHLVLIAHPGTANDRCVDVVRRFIQDKELTMKTDAWRADAFAFDH
jgi:DNA-binding transcriptional LysR family regulator